jgi:hypothetical protein
MEKYYVSGCRDDGEATVTCEDSEATFWTLYARDDKGLSQGIIDLAFREDAEAAMAVYVERDALQEQVHSVRDDCNNQLCALLPDARYMDPPDGGSVTPIEQVTRMVIGLQDQVQKLAALAEERRVFIVNGAEMGYIQLPVFDGDPATSTYQRCLLKPKFAADAVIREIGAKAGKFCDKAPAGYQCTRLAWHDGPCAAVDTNREGQP